MFRIAKAISLFLIMFFSLIFLGCDKHTALLVSLIPLVLGSLNILTGPAFGIAGLTFILAAMSALLPAKYHSGLDFAEQLFSNPSLDRFYGSTDSVKDKFPVK
jgi:hypothetical protein